MSKTLRIIAGIASLEALAGWGTSRDDGTASLGRSRHSRRYRGCPLSVANIYHLPIPVPYGHTRVSGLTLEEAEDLARWAESTGRTVAEQYLVPDQGYTISFR